ncbi:MAG: ABC transporter ATP-binding protein/permease [Clostridia bacterium]|nr:ABC transporter ATP-binding protein/permease [Clostridia bacterium]
MLEIKNVTKIYKMDGYEQKALDDVSINFRKNEFVSILGQSGSGKSTLLNIIGGLDHYTTGDLIINGVSTKNYKDADWDTYRNYKIGFIFQSYNLITHQTILENVELALTLTGVSASTRKKMAKEALEKVGLGEFLKKKPSQLSGGQMQRVAIARALVNNPEIILADEPTGALDSETSVQVMDLLKEVAKEKLVIMVTHNPDLAKEYSTRIVSLKDGKIIDDTEPFDGNEEIEQDDEKKKKSMGILTALSLSKNNLITKRGRTTLTAIAGSIGIIGIALILGLATGVRNYANNLQQDSFGSQAIKVESTIIDTSSSSIDLSDNKKPEHNGKLLAIDDVASNMTVSTKVSTKKNNLKKLKQYIEENRSKVDSMTSNIQYNYNVDLNIFDKAKDGDIIKVNPIDDSDVNATGLSSLVSDNSKIIKNSFGQMLGNNNYELLSGKMPENYNELVLIVNQDEELDLSTMYSINVEDRDEITEILSKASNGEKTEKKNVVYDYNQIIGKKYELIGATNFYQKMGNTWISRENDSNFLNNLYNEGTELKVVGVVKIKDKNTPSGFLGYTTDLTEYVINQSSNSEIVKEQLANKNTNIFTGVAFDGIDATYESNLKKIDAADISDPYSINMYPKDIQSKEDLKAFIDEYNNSASDEDKITYVDEMKSLTDVIGGVVNVISVVLIALVSISLVVSSLMIGIITYVSVLERTKEIGILRAIGASKKDVKRVFRAETMIEGFASGILGVGVAYLISTAANAIVSNFAQIDNIVQITPVIAVILILVSMLLTVLAGAAPASMASKKDPVESLRSE